MEIITKTTRNKRERGNALFLILIAVALFAALSYAITQSGRGGGNVSSQTNLITAGQVTEEPADVRAAVTRMMVTGAAASTITYTGTASSTDVFDQVSGGGGATDVPPPVAACSLAADCAKWFYVTASTSHTSGIFVTGVGTAGATAANDLGGLGMAVLQGTNGLGTQAGVTSAVCTAIQKGLGFSTPSSLIVGANGPVAWATQGTYVPAGSVTTVADAGNALKGQDYACFQNSTSGNNAYYAVLIDQ
jgi:hypothetical protein